MGAEISASITHEINQPLTSVLVNAQACSRRLGVVPPKAEEAIASVRRIVRDAGAVDAVICNIRLLVKRQSVVRNPCNIVDLVQDAVSLIKEDAKRRFNYLLFRDFSTHGASGSLSNPIDRHQSAQECNRSDARE
jgi:C4-dicarboxylate-specific signal transduction histidine kinase